MFAGVVENVGQMEGKTQRGYGPIMGLMALHLLRVNEGPQCTFVSVRLLFAISFTSSFLVSLRSTFPFFRGHDALDHRR